MAQHSWVRRWAAWEPQLRSVLRIVAGFLFIFPGTVKLFAFPIGMPPHGGTAQFPSEFWIGGVIELVGGALMTLGLFTRPVAFLLSGEMAVAYFQFHQPRGLLPVANGGMNAALFCFCWLYLSSAGAGPWSLDALRARRAGHVPGAGSPPGG